MQSAYTTVAKEPQLSTPLSHHLPRAQPSPELISNNILITTTKCNKIVLIYRMNIRIIDHNYRHALPHDPAISIDPYSLLSIIGHYCPLQSISWTDRVLYTDSVYNTAWHDTSHTLLQHEISSDHNRPRKIFVCMLRKECKHWKRLPGTSHFKKTTNLKHCNFMFNNSVHSNILIILLKATQLLVKRPVLVLLSSE